MKCRYKADNTCRDGANNGEKCLYDHSDEVQKVTPEDFKCNICELSFKYQSQFLKHRKFKHPEKVPMCKTIKDGKDCLFGDQCGFSHNPANETQTQNGQNEPAAKEGPASNFWKGKTTTKPPDQIEEMMKMIQTMMVDICQLKQTLSN